MRVLVTGSSGRIGGAIAAGLAARHEVCGLDLAPGPATTQQGDVRDEALLRRLCAGVDAVIHTAALHAPDVGRRSDAEFRDINVSGTEALLDAAVAAGLRRFVLTSTTSLYGHALEPSGGRAAWITEAVDPQPRDIYDQTKLAAEHACAAATQRGLPGLSLRMSRCFDEHPRLVAVYRLYRGVAAEDVVQAHALALNAAVSGFEACNISAQSPFTEQECGALLADARGVLLSHHPWAAAAFSRRGWDLPQRIDRVYVVGKARQLLGYEPRHNFESLFSPRELTGGPAHP